MAVAGWTTRSMLDRYTGASASERAAAEARGLGLGELWNEIRDRIRDTPRDIRVLCPRGHFIADVWLEVPDEQDAIAMWPRGPHKRHAFNSLAGWYGFWMSLSRSHVRTPARRTQVEMPEHPVRATRPMSATRRWRWSSPQPRWPASPSIG